MKGKSESEIVHTHRVSDDKDKDIASVISVQCVINSEERQAGIADTLVFFIFIFLSSVEFVMKSEERRAGIAHTFLCIFFLLSSV